MNKKNAFQANPIQNEIYEFQRNGRFQYCMRKHHKIVAVLVIKLPFTSSSEYQGKGGSNNKNDRRKEIERH